MKQLRSDRSTAWGLRTLALAALVSMVPVLVDVEAVGAAQWTPSTVWTDAVSGGNGIDVDPVSGNVWVVDGYSNTVVKFSPQGQALGQVGGFGTAPGQINGPGDVAVGANGEAFVTDRGNKRISHYAADGTFLDAFGNSSMFSNPLGIATDDAGDVYVADVGNNTVRKFSPSGSLLQSYPALGSGAFGIAVAPGGELWVSSQSGVVRGADAVTGAVEVTIGVGGQTTDVDIDASGNANIVEFNSQRVLVYTPAGQFVDSLSVAPSGFRLAIGPDGRLFVSGGADVKVFDPPVTDDADGVSDAVEDAAPGGGDGNGDSILDSLQANVTSLPTVTAAGYVTVATPSGTSLSAVVSQALPADPAPPAGVAFPLGLLGFEIHGIAVGASVEVQLHLPPGTTPDEFWKLQSGAYVAFPDAVVNGDIVTMTLQDGGAFDADGQADGVIVDPVGPGLDATVATTTTVSSSSNPAVVNAPVTFSAQVAAASGSVEPTGTVVFTIDGVDQSPAVALTAGSASLPPLADLTVGSHGVSARYVPADASFGASDSLATTLTQTITAGPLDHLVLTPSASVRGAGVAQLYSVHGADAAGNDLGDRTSQATLTITPNGTCTASSCTATVVGVHTVRATIGSATGTATLDVRKVQTITFTAPAPKTLLQTPVTVAATSSSGLTVTFTSATPAVCTTGGVNGKTVTLLTAGSCTIAADQPGNATFAAAATISRTFAVSKATQTISFPALRAATVAESPLTISATASSGLPVTFTSTTPSVCTAGGTAGTTIDLLGSGTCTIRADQAGNSTFAAAAAVSRSFAVSQVRQTITFAGLTAKTILQTPVTVSATASSGLPVQFTTTTPTVCTAGTGDGSTIDLVGAGTCTVTAAQSGNATYAPAASISRSFTVSKVAQTITFAGLTTRTLSQSPVVVSATASSGLAVVFTSTTPAVCFTDGSNGTTIVLVAAGTCTVRADQSGDATYKPATAVSRSFTVTPPPPSVSSFTASRVLLAPAGGTVTFTASVSDAATCKLTATPAVAGVPTTVACSTGTATFTVTLPVNTTGTGKNYTFGLTAARSGAASATAPPIVVRVASAAEPVADLSVTGSASADPAIAGQPLTFTLTVRNGGPSSAAVTASVPLPGGATFVSATPSQGAPCTVSAGVVTCTLGTLATGATATIAIVVVPNSAGGVQLSATVTSAANDFNSADNTVTASASVAEPKIVYSDDQTGQLYAMDGPFRSPVAITSQPGAKSDAVVSPDKRSVVYWRQNPTTYASEIWLVNVDGTNERVVTATGLSSVARPSWSPDSTKIVYAAVVDGKWKAFVASAVGAPNPQLLIADMTFGEQSPAYSPDGNSIIFRDSCYRPAPSQCRYQRINADGSGTATSYDTYPVGGGVVWAPDGQWFYFVNSAGIIYRARVDGTLAEPVAQNLGGGFTYWSVSPAGDKIAYTEIVGGKNVISILDVDGSNHQQLTLPMPGADPAGCYSPVWSRRQDVVIMHCYPGSGAIGIYQVSTTVSTPVSPTLIGGSFRSRNPELAGTRPTN